LAPGAAPVGVPPGCDPFRGAPPRWLSNNHRCRRIRVPTARRILDADCVKQVTRLGERGSNGAGRFEGRRMRRGGGLTDAEPPALQGELPARRSVPANAGEVSRTPVRGFGLSDPIRQLVVRSDDESQPKWSRPTCPKRPSFQVGALRVEWDWPALGASGHARDASDQEPVRGQRLAPCRLGQAIAPQLPCLGRSGRIKVRLFAA